MHIGVRFCRTRALNVGTRAFTVSSIVYTALPDFPGASLREEIAGMIGKRERAEARSDSERDAERITTDSLGRCQRCLRAARHCSTPSFDRR
jgi:hypothetical protein